MPIKLAIFDLDDTLYDCFGQRVVAAHRYASQAMVAAGLRAGVDEVFQARMESFRKNPQLEHIDAEVCRRFPVRDAEAVIRAAQAAYFSLPVGKLTLFPGTLAVLRTMKARAIRIFIVTFGDPETQRRKVEALGLDRESAVERIHYADTSNLRTKEEMFRSLLRETGARPEEALVVGDRPDSEILAGKHLGMHVVRIRHGEFAALEPQHPEERPDHEISNIEALLRLPLDFG
jgi:FMN phosphatase YigB (HAD superfamily)